MDERDRVLGRGAIEVVAIRVPVLRQQRIVVAVPEDELARRYLLLLDPDAQRGDDVFDRFHRSDRRRGGVQQIEVLHDHREVAVGVDEARDEGPVA